MKIAALRTRNKRRPVPAAPRGLFGLPARACRYDALYESEIEQAKAMTDLELEARLDAVQCELAMREAIRG